MACVFVLWSLALYSRNILESFDVLYETKNVLQYVCPYSGTTTL